MDTSYLGYRKPFLWKKTTLLLAVLGLLIRTGACGMYYMENYCEKTFSFIWNSENQIQLELNDDGIYNASPYIHTCESTFEAWYTTYPKLMFYFEHLNLDCDEGHLEFFREESGQRRVSGLESNICGNKPQEVFAVDSRYFRIKYVPKKRQHISNVFSIIITAYSEDCPSYAYQCDNSRCIDMDIRCNGYDSCGDGSGCDLETGVIIGIVVGSVAGLAFIVSLIICCICCARKSGKTPGTVQNQVATPAAYTFSVQQGYSQPVYSVNQGSPYPANQGQNTSAGTEFGQPPAYSSLNYNSPSSFSAFSNQGR